MCSHIPLAVLILRCHLEPLQLGEELVTSSDQAVQSFPREPTPRLQTENEGALRTLLRRETGLRLAGPHSPAPNLREDRPESGPYLPVFHQNQGGCHSWELSCPATINQWPPELCGVPTRDTQQACSTAPISGTGPEETPPFPIWALNEAFKLPFGKPGSDVHTPVQNSAMARLRPQYRDSGSLAARLLRARRTPCAANPASTLSVSRPRPPNL